MAFSATALASSSSEIAKVRAERAVSSEVSSSWSIVDMRIVSLAARSADSFPACSWTMRPPALSTDVSRAANSSEATMPSASSRRAVATSHSPEASTRRAQEYSASATACIPLIRSGSSLALSRSSPSLASILSPRGFKLDYQPGGLLQALPTALEFLRFQRRLCFLQTVVGRPQFPFRPGAPDPRFLGRIQNTLPLDWIGKLAGARAQFGQPTLGAAAAFIGLVDPFGQLPEEGKGCFQSFETAHGLGQVIPSLIEPRLGRLGMVDPDVQFVDLVLGCA